MRDGNFLHKNQFTVDGDLTDDLRMWNGEDREKQSEG